MAIVLINECRSITVHESYSKEIAINHVNGSPNIPIRLQHSICDEKHPLLIVRKILLGIHYFKHILTA